MKKAALKKGVAAVLITALTAAALTGCSGGEKSAAANEKENGTRLTMTWWGNQVRNERTQAALDKYHELNPEVTVEGQFFQWDDYWSKLATSAAGKKMPDVVQMDFAFISQYVNKNQLLDLTPYIEDGSIDTSNLPDVVLDMGKMGEGNYGIAAGVNSPAMFYNKTLLEENGIAIKDNMTLEEFIALGKEVYEKTGYRTSLGSASLYMDAWGRANDVQIVSQEMGAKAEDGYVPYFEIIQNGIKEGWFLPPEVGAEGGGNEQDPMVYGSSPETMSWCTLNGSNLLVSYQSAAAEGTEIGITSVPSSNPTKSKYLKPSMFYSISADTKNVEEAVKLLNYMINSSEAYNIMLAERGIPASTKISEEISGQLTKEEQQITSYVNNVVAPDCSPIDPPQPEGYSEVYDLLKKIEQKVGYGEYTAWEASEEYFRKGNEIFAGKK